MKPNGKIAHHLSRQEDTPPIPDQFFAQLYEATNGLIEYNGVLFESADLGKEVPRVGDRIVAPLSKAILSRETRKNTWSLK